MVLQKSGCLVNLTLRSASKYDEIGYLHVMLMLAMRVSLTALDLSTQLLLRSFNLLTDADGVGL